MNRRRILILSLLWLGALIRPFPASAESVTDPQGLWTPFADDIRELLAIHSPLFTRRDGGPGSTMIMLHNPGSEPLPRITIDGVPVGVGHRWCDDPGLLPLAGLSLALVDPLGGIFGESAPSIDFQSVPPDSAAASTNTRFYKGDHESFLRRLSFATQRAPLSLSFDFDERGDHLAWDFKVPGDTRDFGIPYQPFDPEDLVYMGETARRALSVGLRRYLEDGRSLGLRYNRIRQHKTGLPVLGLEHQEIWSDRVVLDWRSPLAGGEVRSSVYINAVDLERDWRRKLDIVRQGARLSYRPDAVGLRVDADISLWRLYDNGDDMAWAGTAAGAVRGSGQRADLAVGADWRLAGLDLQPAVGLGWQRSSGARPQLSLHLPELTGISGLSATLRLDGRAPRSDELLSVESVSTPATRYLLLPNPDLGWESRRSAEFDWRGELFGFGLALNSGLSFLRNGIGWRPETLTPTRGTWENDLDLDARTLSLSLGRQGRLAGRYSLLARAAVRSTDLKSGVALGLPPGNSAFLRMLWQRPVFKGDGVVELGYVLDHGGATVDPWIPGVGPQLPAATFHHGLIGFRLIGVDLGLELRNLANQRIQLSSGALSNGFEKRWRLHWTFFN